jgi:glycosyltransferase involved in cell wall biosynthesis
MPVTQLAGSQDELVRLVAELMSDDDKWHDIGERSRRTFIQEHSPDRIAAAYLAVLSQLSPTA